MTSNFSSDLERIERQTNKWIAIICIIFGPSLLITAIVGSVMLANSVDRSNGGLWCLAIIIASAGVVEIFVGKHMLKRIKSHP